LKNIKEWNCRLWGSYG